MTLMDYSMMNLDELRSYVLSHREDIDAFEMYIDRSKVDGRMVSINFEDANWEEELAKKMSSSHYSQEKDS
jgi:hypothetical protein